MLANTFPRLIADIGGTNARFSIETTPYTYSLTQVLECKNFPTLAQAGKHYLNSINLSTPVKYAALALPTPNTDGKTLNMINNPWSGQSISQSFKEMGIESGIILNDFHALALSIPHIDNNNLIKIGNAETQNSNKPIAIIGPGTGLGMSTLIKHPKTGEYLAIPAEGGRTSFSPANIEEVELWEFAHRRFNHVSVERFLCGPGLCLIYEALCHIEGKIFEILPTPAEITEKGLKGTDWLSTRTLEVFCRMLGTAASNLAVTVNAFGGLYIGGGIIPKIIEYFKKSDFRNRFEAKGRYHAILAQIPIHVIMEPFPAFLGASYALDIYIKQGYIP